MGLVVASRPGFRGTPPVAFAQALCGEGRILATDGDPGGDMVDQPDDIAQDTDLVENEAAYALRSKLHRVELLAQVQGELFDDLLATDPTDLLRWPFANLDQAMGPLRPGTFHIVGARPGNGKTTLMMNALEAWVREGRSILYCGMEMSPQELRLQWAAWACGYDMETVLERQWHKLPDDARDRLRAHRDLQVQVFNRFAIFPDDPRLSMGSLAHWISATADLGIDAVVIDHLHRMDWGGGDATEAMSEGVVQIKELAKRYDLPIIAAAQLNRSDRDILADYQPLPLEALKQTGSLEQEADTVLMGYRALLPGVREGDVKLVRFGQAAMSTIVDEDVMALRIAKHRLRGRMKGVDVHQYIHQGRLFDSRLDRDTAAGKLAARIATGQTTPPPEYREGGVLAWTLKQVEEGS